MENPGFTLRNREEVSIERLDELYNIAINMHYDDYYIFLVHLVSLLEKSKIYNLASLAVYDQEKYNFVVYVLKVNRLEIYEPEEILKSVAEGKIFYDREKLERSRDFANNVLRSCVDSLNLINSRNSRVVIEYFEPDLGVEITPLEMENELAQMREEGIHFITITYYEALTRLREKYLQIIEIIDNQLATFFD